jgi:hypothetical protein
MEGESIDSGRDNYPSAGGDMRDPDIFDDLDGGSARGGLHAGGSGLPGCWSFHPGLDQFQG